MKSLEQILSGGAEAAPEAASEAAGPEGPPPDAGDGPGDGPAGDTPEGDPEAGAPAGPEAGDGPDRMVPVSALIDERRKRRAAEERLVRREEAPAGAGPRAGVPRFRDDPEGYVKALEGAIAAEISAVRVDAAESAARARYPDFDPKARAQRPPDGTGAGPRARRGAGHRGRNANGPPVGAARMEGGTPVHPARVSAL